MVRVQSVHVVTHGSLLRSDISQYNKLNYVMAPRSACILICLEVTFLLWRHSKVTPRYCEFSAVKSKMKPDIIISVLRFRHVIKRI